MIRQHVVNLATEYFNQCADRGATGTLVGMHWYIDGRDKTLPLVGEINEALKKQPSVFVTRENAFVVFSTDGTERTVTSEDMKQADKQYRREFAAAVADLRK